MKACNCPNCWRCQNQEPTSHLAEDQALLVQGEMEWPDIHNFDAILEQALLETHPSPNAAA